MNLDKFSRRRRDDAEPEAGAPEYDFTKIAEAAVSDMRQQQSDNTRGGDRPLDFSPRTFDDQPGIRRRDFSSRRNRTNDIQPDQTYYPEELPESPAAPPRRRTFGSGRVKVSETPADAWDQPRDRESIDDLPQPERRRFDQRSTPETQPEAWDQPRDRESIEEPAQRGRKIFSFGKGKTPKQSPDISEIPDSADGSADSSQTGRRLFGFGKNKAEIINADAAEQAQHRSENETSTSRGRRFFDRRGSSASSDIPDDPFDFDDSASPRSPVSSAPDIIADSDDDPVSFNEPVTSPDPSEIRSHDIPAAENSERRVFNAATQPNYSYMTDYPEEQPAASEPAANSSAAGGILNSVRSSVLRKFNRDEPGVEYYTPPANRAPVDVRRRQKRRNRKPLAPWVKYALFGVGLTAAFVLILFAAFYFIVTGRLNYVGDSIQNPVYLSVEEYANLNADLTDTEENAAEFTEPLNIREPDDDIKVIMLVSSDSRIGDVYDQSGRKKTNESAKADSIMLVAIDHEHRRLRVASIMTDTYVRIQDYKTNKLSKAYYYDTANGDYTLPCLRQAVRDNFGVTPDNFVVVDFSAFQILINRLGGINVEVSADEAYYMSAHPRYGDFPRFNSAGEYTMSGAEALNYARMRAVGNDDYDRSARQRVILNRILDKLKDMSRIELAELAYALLPELPTDMTAGELYGYITDAADIASYEVNEVTFPITNSWRYGTASVRPDNESLMNPYEDTTAVSNSDIGGSTVSPAPTLNKFTVIVTNFQFNSTVLQKYLYDNDDSYLNGTAANGITVPEIIAPLEVDSPAAALTQTTAQ